MRWRATNDAELVAAMRQGSYEALREFYARFEPLLARYAARAGVSMDAWEEDAHDVLSDVVLALIASDRPARSRNDVRDIHGYLQRAFRNRMLSARRAAERRAHRDMGATSSAAETGERIVLSSFSEGSVRDSGASYASDAATLSPALSRLATVLDGELSVSERQMLTWVSNSVPMRDIALWLEVSYAAAKVRLSRARSRLRERALRHVNECAGSEREELLEFFRRSTRKETETTRIAIQYGAAEPGERGSHGDL
jgi:RNA polymerase sigma factor (sigma-70 family)